MFSRSTIANTTSGIWDLPQSIGFTTAQTDESRSVGVLAILSPQTEELGLRPAQVRHCSLPSIQMMTELPLEPRLLHRFAPIWNSSSRIQRTYTVVYLQMGSSHIYWSTKPVQVCIVEQNLRRWYHIQPSLLAETIFPLAYSLSSLQRTDLGKHPSSLPSDTSLHKNTSLPKLGCAGHLVEIASTCT